MNVTHFLYLGYSRNRRDGGGGEEVDHLAAGDGVPRILTDLSRDVIAMIGGDIRLSCHIQNLQNKTVGVLKPYIMIPWGCCRPTEI
jgi:hypothetical protein